MSSQFSNMPRDFKYQQQPFNQPLELYGNIKRLDVQFNTEGKWDKLIQRTSDFSIITNPQKQYDDLVSKKGQEYLDGKRTIYPEMNKENEKINSIRVYKSQYESSQGNITALMNKANFENYEQPFTRKMVKPESNNAETTQVPEKRLSKQIKKKEQDYCSHISQLPGSAKYLDEDHHIKRNPSVDLTKAQMLRQMNDMRSMITTLPGSTLCRIQNENINKDNTLLPMKRFTYTTPELYDKNNIQEQHPIKPTQSDNYKTCRQEYDINSENLSINSNVTNRSQNKKNFTFFVAENSEQVDPDNITGNKKGKTNKQKDMFNSHFTLG